MDRSFDICVVGAGLWGSAAAKYLSEDKSIRVCLLGPEEPNRQDFAKADVLGSHYDEGRITTGMEIESLRVILCQRTISRFRELERKTGISFFTEVGCVIAGPTGSNQIVEKFSHERGVSIKRYNAREIRSIYPFIKDDPKTQDFLVAKELSGYISPRALISAQKTICHLQGCDIVNDVALRVIQTQEGGRNAVCISTKKSGDIHANRVLLCTGGFSNFHQILPEDKKLDIQPQGLMVVKVEVTGKELAKLDKMPAMVKLTDETPDIEDFYLLPPVKYPNGKYYMKLGHRQAYKRNMDKLEDIKQWYIQKGDRSTGDHILQMLHRSIDFKETSVEFDAAITTFTPTDHAYCGMISPSIGVLVGGNGRGAAASDEMGKMGAKLIAKGRWDHDFPEEVFKPRFKSTVAKL